MPQRLWPVRVDRGTEGREERGTWEVTRRFYQKEPASDSYSRDTNFRRTLTVGSGSGDGIEPGNRFPRSRCFLGPTSLGGTEAGTTVSRTFREGGDGGKKSFN